MSNGNGTPVQAPSHVERVYHALVGVTRRRRVHEGYPASWDDPFAERLLLSLSRDIVSVFEDVYLMGDSEFHLNHPRRCARCFEAAINSLVKGLNETDVTEELDFDVEIERLANGGE